MEQHSQDGCSLMAVSFGLAFQLKQSSSWEQQRSYENQDSLNGESGDLILFAIEDGWNCTMSSLKQGSQILQGNLLEGYAFSRHTAHLHRASWLRAEIEGVSVGNEDVLHKIFCGFQLRQQWRSRSLIKISTQTTVSTGKVLYNRILTPCFPASFSLRANSCSAKFYTPQTLPQFAPSICINDPCLFLLTVFTTWAQPNEHHFNFPKNIIERNRHENIFYVLFYFSFIIKKIVKFRIKILLAAS